MRPRERRYHRGLDPVRSASSALRAPNYLRYAFSASSLRTLSSSSRSRLLGAGGLPPEPFGRPLGFAPSASVPPSRYAAHQFWRGVLEAIPYAAMASEMVAPRSTTALAASHLCSKVYLACFGPMDNNPFKPIARYVKSHSLTVSLGIPSFRAAGP